MTKLRVDGYSISLDGFGAGPSQSRENPLGVGGQRLHEWLVPTRAFRRVSGGEGGETGPDDEIASRGFDDVGAWIIGRNMFGPIRGPWTGEWNGWWGEDPPFHAPVFVLTHHARASLAMKGGTVFHFVCDGIERALNRAVEAAAGKDVRIGGGAATIREYLRAGLVDEMRIAIAPVLLGSGEPLLAGIDLPSLGYRVIKYAPTAAAAHIFIAKGRP